MCLAAHSKKKTAVCQSSNTDGFGATIACDDDAVEAVARALSPVLSLLVYEVDRLRLHNRVLRRDLPDLEQLDEGLASIVEVLEAAHSRAADSY